MALTTNLDLKISGAKTLSADIGTNKYTFSHTYSKSMSNGVGANQANMVFTDVRSTSGNDDLDLYGGLTSTHNETINFTNVKTIMIESSASNTTNILIGGHDTAPCSSMFSDATDQLVLKPGGVFLLSVSPNADGYAVTATTADILRIAAASGTVEYSVIIIGDV